MRSKTQWALIVMTIGTLAIVPVSARAETHTKATKEKAHAADHKAESKTKDVKLPKAVQSTFDDRFPNAVIEKTESEKEGGVVVYDIEFREGKSQKETDIAEDGTMLEVTYVIGRGGVPKDAMKKIEEAAKGAKMGRTERVEVTHQTKDGKVVKLEKPATHYAVEMRKDGKFAEIVVDAKGKVIEEAQWEPGNSEKKAEPKAEK